LLRRLLSNTILLTGSNLLGRVLGYVGFVLFTRHFSSQEVGVYAVVLTGFLFASMGANLGLDKIFIRDLVAAPDEAGRLFAAGLTLKVLASLLAYAVGVGALLAIYPEFSTLHFPVAVYLTSVVTVALAQLLESVFMAHERMGLAAIGQLAERGIQLLTFLVASFGVLDMGSLLVALALPGLVRVVAPLLLARDLFPRPDFTKLSARMRGLLGEACKLLLVEVMAGIYFRVDIFLLARMASFRDTGLYQTAYKVFEFFVAIFSGFLMAVFPVLARRRHDVPIVLILAAGLAVIVPGAVLAILIRGPLLGLFGPDYRQVGTVLAILLCTGPLVFVTSLLANYAITLGRLPLLIRLAVILVTLNIGLNVILIPTHGTLGAAIATLICETASMCMLIYGLRDCLGWGKTPTGGTSVA
jgi:O-antigen/teichoic acid export membrane protein